MGPHPAYGTAGPPVRWTGEREGGNVDASDGPSTTATATAVGTTAVCTRHELAEHERS